MDIASDKKLFFEYFKIKPVRLNKTMRDMLEGFWLSKYYETSYYIDAECRSVETWGTYDVCYSSDQWYGCDLFQYLQGGIEDSYVYKRVAHGEGDSPFYALLGMTIDGHKNGLFKRGDLTYLRNIFKGK